ncbi:NAD synthetase [Marinobacter lacisalsi]|uniref:NAD synthetase n=1 Tax=Marinobacter lacisalsi TaxID=475979 RepID=A0ABV8QMA3_9GAMM
MLYSILTNQPSFPQERLRTRLNIVLDQEKIFKAIDDDYSLIGAGVVFIDGHGTSVTLREFEPVCFTKPVKVILREPPIEQPPIEYITEVKTNERESKLVLEAAGAILSCGSAVLGWIVVVGSGAAIPFSAGSSTFLTGLSYGAAAASTVQCANSSYRTFNEINDPAANDELDSEAWYRHATLALDAISVGGATAAGLSTIKLVKIKVASGVTPRKALSGLSRQERRRFTQEVERARLPGISNQLIKKRQREGITPKRFPNEAVKATTIKQIKEAVGAGLTFLGSASGGGIRNLAIAVYSED